MADVSNRFFDIYLWTFPENDKLFKIGHLTEEDALQLANQWFELDELRDYALVLEGSALFVGESSIEVKTKEWLEDIINNSD